MGSMGGRELAVMMALALFWAPERGRRPCAGCEGRRCCNVLREIASFGGPCDFFCYLQETKKAAPAACPS